MSIYDLSVRTIVGDEVSMGQFRGSVILVVNTASKCGFTPQYQGLEALYQSYKDRGLVILGFPCNQFGGQEPRSNGEVAEFCELNFGVTFPLFEKIDVNGPNSAPLFKLLKQEAPGLLGSEKIKWNFTKFLIAKDGRVVKRFASIDKPASLSSAIEKLL